MISYNGPPLKGADFGGSPPKMLKGWRRVVGTLKTAYMGFFRF